MPPTNHLSNPDSIVKGPAICLIVVASICPGVMLLAFAFDTWLLLSGAFGRLDSVGNSVRNLGTDRADQTEI